VLEWYDRHIAYRYNIWFKRRRELKDVEHKYRSLENLNDVLLDEKYGSGF